MSDQNDIRLRASTINLDPNGFILCIKLKDPYSHRSLWSPPGGLIEPGEKPELAAERETLEETGYSVKILPQLTAKVQYRFHWNGHQRLCETIFFGSIIRHQTFIFEEHSDVSYNLGPAWIRPHELEVSLKKHPNVWEAINEIITSLKPLCNKT
jgi:8-oxo-dGTP pyrophosphatase MutT (NUDIX family)